MPPKVRDMLKRLHQDGWRESETKGSHRQLEHPTKPGKVTVPGQPGEDLAEGTWRSILKQSGLKR
jgi:predicted RNA binding protein YcfA (HicA-like mRNA interferase family)